MNIQLRHIFALFVVFGSLAFGVSVASEQSHRCVAPYKQIGAIEDFSDQDLVPDCYSSEPTESAAEVMVCAFSGPQASQFGPQFALGVGSNGLAAFAPACFSTNLVPLSVEQPAGEPDSRICADPAQTLKLTQPCYWQD